MERLNNLNKFFNEKERRRLNALQQEEVGGLPIMSPAEIRLSCLENDGYETPELNEKIYLHFRGFRKIENLEPYVNCKALWLESNGFDEIGDSLEALAELRCLYLSKNLLGRIEGFSSLKNLTILDLSYNRLTKVENLSECINLKTVNLSRNSFITSESISHLVSCLSLDNIDLSHCNIPNDEDMLNTIIKIPSLLNLSLNGNEITKIVSFRKKIIAGIPKLFYLDRPIEEIERLRSEAFIQAGGLDGNGTEAEKKVMEEYKANQEAKRIEEQTIFRNWQKEQKEKSRELFLQNGGKSLIQPMTPEEIEKRRIDKERAVKAEQDMLALGIDKVGKRYWELEKGQKGTDALELLSKSVESVQEEEEVRKLYASSGGSSGGFEGFDKVKSLPPPPAASGSVFQDSDNEVDNEVLMPPPPPPTEGNNMEPSTYDKVKSLLAPISNKPQEGGSRIQIEEEEDEEEIIEIEEEEEEEEEDEKTGVDSINMDAYTIIEHEDAIGDGVADEEEELVVSKNKVDPDGDDDSPEAQEIRRRRVEESIYIFNKMTEEKKRQAAKEKELKDAKKSGGKQVIGGNKENLKNNAAEEVVLEVEEVVPPPTSDAIYWSEQMDFALAKAVKECFFDFNMVSTQLIGLQKKCQFSPQLDRFVVGGGVPVGSTITVGSWDKSTTTSTTSDIPKAMASATMANIQKQQEVLTSVISSDFCRLRWAALDANRWSEQPPPMTTGSGNVYGDSQVDIPQVNHAIFVQPSHITGSGHGCQPSFEQLAQQVGSRNSTVNNNNNNTSGTNSNNYKYPSYLKVPMVLPTVKATRGGGDDDDEEEDEEDLNALD